MIGDTKFPVTDAQGIPLPNLQAHIYHQAAAPSDPKGLNRTIEEHGPMQDTGEVRSGRIVVECLNKSCGYQGYFQHIIPWTAIQERQVLRRQLNDLNQRMGFLYARVIDGVMDQGHFERITVKERAAAKNLETRLAELERLAPDTVVGLTFHRSTSGSLVALLAPAEVAV